MVFDELENKASIYYGKSESFYLWLGIVAGLIMSVVAYYFQLRQQNYSLFMMSLFAVVVGLFFCFIFLVIKKNLGAIGKYRSFFLFPIDRAINKALRFGESDKNVHINQMQSAPAQNALMSLGAGIVFIVESIILLIMGLITK